MKIEISVVLPAYNERENIKDAVVRADRFLKTRFNNYEILVVSDGGTDGTEEVVKKLLDKFKNLRLIAHKVNRGYGATLRDGFVHARGNLVFYTDADNQYDINELDRLRPLMGKYDLVAGYRLNHSDPYMRVLISRVYNFLIRFLLGLKIRDVDCSFKLYKQSLFKKISMISDTGLIDAEVLIKAIKSGYKIGQIGVNHYPRTKGKTIYEVGGRNNFFALVHPKVPIQIFIEIKKLWKDLRPSS